MKIKLNKKFTIFAEYLDHVYNFWKKNKELEYAPYSGETHYFGFKKAKNLSGDLIEAVDNSLDWLWQQRWTKKVWVNEVFSYTGYSFWEEFVRK